MKGTGTIDETLTAGTFTVVATYMGLDVTFKGDACAAKKFTLPLGLGSVTWAGMDCPVAAGTVTQTIDFKTASVVPAVLAKIDVKSTAYDQNGESITCLNTHLAKKADSTMEV